MALEVVGPGRKRIEHVFDNAVSPRQVVRACADSISCCECPASAFVRTGRGLSSSSAGSCAKAAASGRVVQGVPQMGTFIDATQKSLWGWGQLPSA